MIGTGCSYGIFVIFREKLGDQAHNKRLSTISNLAKSDDNVLIVDIDVKDKIWKFKNR